jgi:hypothetical protein
VVAIFIAVLDCDIFYRPAQINLFGIEGFVAVVVLLGDMIFSIVVCSRL